MVHLVIYGLLGRLVIMMPIGMPGVVKAAGVWLLGLAILILFAPGTEPTAGRIRTHFYGICDGHTNASVCAAVRSASGAQALAVASFCGARIGKNVSIGWFASVMARDRVWRLCRSTPVDAGFALTACCVLGRQSEISSFTLIYGSSDLVIGDQSYVGPQCLINADEPVRSAPTRPSVRSMVFTHGSFLPFTQGTG